MGFEDLADIHAAGHAQGIEHDVDRVPSSRYGMSSIGTDAADHALVAVAARHLVAGLKLALHRNEHLDHLHHARRQFVAARSFSTLSAKRLSRRDLDSSYC